MSIRLLSSTFSRTRRLPRSLATFSSIPQNVVSEGKCSARQHEYAPVYVHSALDSGCMDYSRSWAWQQTLLNRRLDYQREHRQSGCNDDNNGAGEEDNEGSREHTVNRDRMLLLEHHPVYTLGRGADENNLAFLDSEPGGGAEKRQRLSRKARGPGSARLAVDRLNPVCRSRPEEEEVDILANCPSPVYAPNEAPIYRVERGGEVTYHGPGQIVGYPLLDLRHAPYKKDLHWYLRMVEEVVIETLRAYDIEGCRDEENTGVWVGDDKVAAVGVSSSRWITTHGFAINVEPDLSYFDTSVIIPCGIEGKGVTSISKILRERGDGRARYPSVVDVAEATVQSFERVFGVSTVGANPLR